MKIFSTLISLALIAGITCILFTLFLFNYYGKDLPSYDVIAHYEPPIVTRIYAADGKLIEEYAKERRLYLPIEEIPDLVKNAFLSAEDKHFYDHPGIDFVGVGRAALTNIKNLGSGKRLVGASTITQQVAKNFLLTNEVSFVRKIKEAILTLRIEQAYNKDHILELYLNEFHLGHRSYGVASAALNYFNKSLDELTIDEAAFLAALPKAPSHYHPVRHPEAAKIRRDWVIDRMLEDERISTSEALNAKNQPIYMAAKPQIQTVNAPYFSEEIRQKLINIYGNDKFYTGGLNVQTSLNSAYQSYADKSLKNGLMAYDKRMGWRGPIIHLDVFDDWQKHLKEVEAQYVPKDWRVALVFETTKSVAKIIFVDQLVGTIPLTKISWARASLPNRKVGPKPTSVTEVLKSGDIIYVKKVKEEVYALEQLPEVEGGIIAMDPHTGRILAMSGGFDFEKSAFNRATQANRQTGSAFKPFVYLTAFNNGFTPSSILLDAPITLEQGYGLGKWKPSNVTKTYFGPTPLRKGMERSRNIMTVRLSQKLGIEKIAKTAESFGIVDYFPRQLSMASGAGESTLLKMVRAYAMLVNGGKEITPTYIDKVQNRFGKILFKSDNRSCENCENIQWIESLPIPKLINDFETINDSRNIYQVVSLMEGVIKRGSGWRVKQVIKKPIAGKTGTTNDEKDAWFIGFTPDLVVGVFVGFDSPIPMGLHEGGSRVASPIFANFMKEALKDKPATPFRVPSGMRFLKVNPEDGSPVIEGKNYIWEGFIPGTEPDIDQKQYVQKLKSEFQKKTTEPSEDKQDIPPIEEAPQTDKGIGGLY